MELFGVKFIPTGKADIEMLKQIPDSLELKKGRMPSNAQRDVYEKIVGKERGGEPIQNGPYERAAKLITTFDVYDPKDVRVVVERTPLQEGDTVGLEVPFFPGVSMFFGCRVVSCYNEVKEGRWRAGFSYHTLKGHPVMGEESFTAEKDAKTGIVTITMRSWSVPGMPLTAMLGPLLHNMQKKVANDALDYMLSKVVN